VLGDAIHGGSNDLVFSLGCYVGLRHLISIPGINDFYNQWAFGVGRLAVILVYFYEMILFRHHP
jgi:hypothetical protein